MGQKFRFPFKKGDKVIPNPYHLKAQKLKLDPSKKYAIVGIKMKGTRRTGQKIQLAGIEGYFRAIYFNGVSDLDRDQWLRDRMIRPFKVGDHVRVKMKQRCISLCLIPGKYYEVSGTNGHDLNRRGQYIKLKGFGDKFYAATSFQARGEKRK